MKIDLKEQDRKILLEILGDYLPKIYAFGSRVKGTASEFSDLDLCYKGDLETDLVRSLKHKLRESDLRFKVDLIDFNDANEDFQKLIANDLLNLSAVL